MRLRVCLLLLLCLSGCSGRLELFKPDPEATPEVKPETPEVSARYYAEAFAKQLELQNASVDQQPPTSALGDSILNQGAASGIPQAVIDKIRDACPALSAHPGTKLDKSQIDRIRNVR